MRIVAKLTVLDMVVLCRHCETCAFGYSRRKPTSAPPRKTPRSPLTPPLKQNILVCDICCHVSLYTFIPLLVLPWFPAN